MLKFPKMMEIFKVEEAKNFFKAKNGGKDMLPHCLEYPTTIPEDLSTIHVSQLKKLHFMKKIL